jgi:hypothetical protein
MNNSVNAAALRKLQRMAIFASVALIAMMLSADVFVYGWSSLIAIPGGNILFGLGFWLMAGVVAGIVLGKMDSVVLIGNAEGRRVFKSPLDNMIVLLSCNTFVPGQLVQNQIANLWSGVIGAAVVYAICQLLYAITGTAMLGNFPDGVLAVIPFVIGSTNARLKGNRT